MPERRDDSLFLAARTGDLGGVDVILSFALLLDTKEINQSTRYLALYCVRATATTVLDGEWLWRRLCSVHRIGILGGHAAPRHEVLVPASGSFEELDVIGSMQVSAGLM